MSKLPSVAFASKTATITLCLLVSSFSRTFGQNSDDLLKMQRSPYFLGENEPRTLYQSAFSATAIVNMLGGNTAIWALFPPTNQDFYAYLKESLALGMVAQLRQGDDESAKINDILGAFPQKLGQGMKTLGSITDFVQKQRMAAVRSRDKDNLKIWNGLLSKIKALQGVGGAVQKLVENAGTINDALQIVDRAAQPLEAYSDALAGIDALLTDDSTDGSVRQALTDVRTVLADESKAFTVNLRNSTGDMLSVIGNLGARINDANPQLFGSLLKKVMPKGSLARIDEFTKARQQIHDLLGGLLPIDSIPDLAMRAYTADFVDVGLHGATMRLLSSNIAPTPKLMAVKLLYLVESGVLARVGAMLLAASQAGLTVDASAIETAKGLSLEAVDVARGITPVGD